MKNKIALTVIALISLSGAAMAQMNQNGHGQRQNMMNNGYNNTCQELQLTDEQVAQMQSLRDNMRAEKQAAREARRAEMNKFYNNPTFNADEAKQLAQKHRDERAVRKMKHRYDMNQILTPEQREQHANMMQQHRNGKHMKGQKGNNCMNGYKHNRQQMDW